MMLTPSSSFTRKKILDVSGWPVDVTPPAGANPKLILHKDGLKYMLKFSEFRQSGVEIPYYISEYISCCIGKMLGFQVQDVTLVRYKSQNAVMIKLFNHPLVTFAGFGSSTLSHERLVYDLDLFSEAVQGYKFVCDLDEYMWGTFMLDSFVCNLDRHPNNWGFFKTSNGMYDKAPLIDFGNSLYSINAENVEKMFDVSGYIERYSNSAVKYEGKSTTFRNIIRTASSPHLLKAKELFKVALLSLRVEGILSEVKAFSPKFSEYYDFLARFFKAQEEWYHEN